MSRSVLHQATTDYDMNEYRYLYRVLLEGERPIAEAAAAELTLAYKNISPLGKAKGLPATRTAANALMFLSSMGRVDDAFHVAGFGRNGVTLGVHRDALASRR